MTHITKTTTPTPTHFTLPAILPAMITGLFILTACGGGALPNDASVAPDTQNDRCADNPLADGCQASAGFLSVNLDEDIGNQEAESSVAPPTPKPVVNTPPAPKPQETPVVKKTAPVLGELAASQTAPTPAPTTSVSSYDFVPETSSSTYSSPAPERSSSAVSGDSGASGQQSASVTAATIGALDARVAVVNDQFGRVANLADLKNQFLTTGWTYTQVASDVILFDQRDTKGKIILVAAGTPILPANIPTYAPIVRKNLDRTGLVLGDSLYMNLYNARYDGVAIGGDAEDGIDFLTATTRTITGVFQNLGGGRGILDTRVITVSRFHYAGILAGTNLGAPVSTTDPTAIWNGSFRTDDARYPVDFRLTVTFGATDATRTISAFVKDTATRAGENDYYLLAGTYTDAGLLTGTVNYGEFTGGERNAPTGDRTSGTLQGLIGVEGAVGVFISDVAESTATVTATGVETFTNGYVGGFVASATLSTAERVLYNDWFESFDVASTDGVVETPSLRAEVTGETDDGDDTFTNQFLGISEYANALDERGAGTVTQRGGLTLADDADSGVSFFSNGISLTTLTDGSQSYAGLLSGTDLGAPLTSASTVGEWQGKFKSVGGYYFGAVSRDTLVETELDLDFTLTVTFSGGTGTVDAFVPIDGNSRHFYLTGTYDDKGVITGDVRASFFTNNEKGTHRAVNGVLTGLIGAEGAVGAFISNADNYNYAGGFVAAYVAPFVVPDDDNMNLVDYSDWARHQEGLSNTANTVSPSNQFLGTNDGDTALAGSGTVQNVAKAGGNLVIDGATVGGFSVFTNGTQFYAGILYGTDLGAPITETNKMVTWSGSFRSIGGYDRDETPIGGRVDRETNFDLEITFGGTGEGGSIAAFVPASSSSFYRIDGVFGANGYITGNVNFGRFVGDVSTTPLDSRANNGVLTGLIGQKGAIGVFVSNPVDPSVTTGEHNFTFAGGFAVAPAADTSGPDEETASYTYHATETATYSDWTASFNTDGVNAGETLQDSGVTALDIASFEGNYIKLDVSGDIVINKVINKENTLNTLTTTTVRLNENSGEDGYESGFAYAFDSDSFQRFAGLLPTTDVGGAITAGPAKAIWTGSLKGTAAAPLSSNDFKLEVAFTGSGGTINSLDGDGTIGFAPVSGAPDDINFVGAFNDAGVMSGTTFWGFAGTGTFNGLIGQKGAVGVFRGEDGVGDSFAGGFVVKPPSE